jgi:hypothetical protein
MKQTRQHGLVAVLSTGEEIPISRRRRTAFSRLLRARDAGLDVSRG